MERKNFISLQKITSVYFIKFTFLYFISFASSSAWIDILIVFRWHCRKALLIRRFLKVEQLMSHRLIFDLLKSKKCHYSRLNESFFKKITTKRFKSEFKSFIFSCSQAVKNIDKKYCKKVFRPYINNIKLIRGHMCISWSWENAYFRIPISHRWKR